MTTKNNHFGTVTFFRGYIAGQLAREAGKNKVEVVQRIFYSMSSLILETQKGKEVLLYTRNLHQVCEETIEKFSKGKVFE